MFRIHALQAAYGDCFMIEFGTTGDPKCVLVDGGPPGTYQASLRMELEKIGNAGGKIEAAILSHVDSDHIVGLLELFTGLRQQHAPIAVKALWHNSFGLKCGLR